MSQVDQWPKKFAPRVDSDEVYRWEVGHTEQTGHLTLFTEDEDFLPTRVYFVNQGEELKLDWFASVSWSAYSFTGLKTAIKSEATKLESGVLVRCLLRRRNEFYAGPYNEDEHAAYMILSPDEMQYFWTYVDRGSDLDTELRKLLDHGSFVVDLKKDVLVTLRLRRGKKDALPLQLELMELIHPEWVTP